MRQIAYPTALGWGCLMGGNPLPLAAAEWSITPSYSSSFDYDSNRRLLENGKGTEAAVLTADIRFEKALENSSFIVEPHYAFRRFSDSTLGNGDDRTVSAIFNRPGERSTLNLSASYLDQATPLTEALETGIILDDTRRHQVQAGLSWNWSQTELWQLVTQISYLNSRYYGRGRAQLPGYRYPSASAGERFAFSEKGSFTISTYGSVLSSDSRGNSSHEQGLQGEIIYAFSERTRLDASLGQSSRVLAGQRSHGTDASVSLTHAMTLGNLSLAYTRSLVPYGTGFLVERQQLTASVTRPLTPYLDTSFSYQRIENNRTAIELNLDRRSYDVVAAALSWHPTETWTCLAQVQGLRTVPPGASNASNASNGTIKDWRTTLSLTWNPRPWSRSR